MKKISDIMYLILKIIVGIYGIIVICFLSVIIGIIVYLIGMFVYYYGIDAYKYRTKIVNDYLFSFYDRMSISFQLVAYTLYPCQNIFLLLCHSDLIKIF